AWTRTARSPASRTSRTSSGRSSSPPAKTRPPDHRRSLPVSAPLRHRRARVGLGPPDFTFTQTGARNAVDSLRIWREDPPPTDVSRPTKEPAMALSRVQLFALGLGVVALLAARNIGTRAEEQAASAARHAGSNPITGEGLPNPAPTVTRNWGQLPRGRRWGKTAGIDIDPTDGNVWAYERCGAGTAGGGPVDCDNTPLDPIFKFDRKTGAVLANFGKGVMVTP